MVFSFIKKNPFDFLIIFFLICSVTSLNNWIASYFSISLTRIGILSIFLVSSYLLININIIMQLLQNRTMWVFLLFFLIVPIMTLPFSPMSRDLRSISIYLLNIAHILSFMVIMLKFPLRIIGILALVSLLIAYAGAFLSVWNPSLFDYQFDANILQSSGATSAEAGTKLIQGRAFGFLIEPNTLGSNIICLTLVYVCFYKTKYAFTKLLFLGISFLAILLTGSRGATLNYMVFLLVLSIYYLKHGIPLTLKRVSTNFVLLLSLLSVLVGVFFISQIVTSKTTAELNKTNMYYESPTERIIRFMKGDTEDNGSENSRLSLIRHYFHEVISYPIPRGLFAMDYNYYSNKKIGGSHNEFLRIAYELSILCLLSMLIYFAFFFFGKNRYTLHYSPPFLFLAFCVIFIGCMLSHTVSVEKHYGLVLAAAITIKILLQKRPVYIE